MNGFISTFKAGFKYLWSNIPDIVILVIFPNVIILILGMALGGYINPDLEIESVVLAFSGSDNSGLADFLESGEASRFVELVKTSDNTAAIAMLKDKEAKIAIIEENGNIEVYKTNEESVGVSVAVAMIGSYRQIGAAATLAAMNGKNPYEFINADVKIAENPLGFKSPDAIEYYSVTMLIMILLYAGMNATELFAKSNLGEMGNRLRLAPVRRSVTTAGLLAASTFTSFIQGLCTFVFTSVVYGVNWGEHIPAVLLTLFAVVAFSQAFCLFVMLIVRNNAACTGIIQVTFWVSTFVSKGYSKISFSESAERIFQYAPNALAQTAVFGLIYGGENAKIWSNILLLFVIGAIFYVLAFIAGKRRLS